jgi:hypothetical protein
MAKHSEEMMAALSQLRGAAAAKIKDPEKKRKFIEAQGKSEQSGKMNADYDRMKSEAEDTLATDGENVNSDAKRIAGSYKKGGKVPKTGIYKLHKKEVVIPAKKARGRGVAEILSGKK